MVMVTEPLVAVGFGMELPGVFKIDSGQVNGDPGLGDSDHRIKTKIVIGLVRNLKERHRHKSPYPLCSPDTKYLRPTR